MIDEPQRYTISLGSNVRPMVNMGRMLTALLGLGSGEIWLSRIIRTEPIGMDSAAYFLNTAVCLTTSLSPTELKTRFNQIETDLGRDRSDPHSKVKDRPADLDIVAVCRPEESLPTAVLPPEPYVRPLVIEIWQAQGALTHLPRPNLAPGVPLGWHGQIIGLQPVRLAARVFSEPAARVISEPAARVISEPAARVFSEPVSSSTGAKRTDY